MEDAARLAVFEQCVSDKEFFITILKTILEGIQNIIKNPHDDDQRRLRSYVFADYLKLEGVWGYFRYVGFNVQDTEIIYPQDKDVHRLTIAKVAIERKLKIVGPLIKKEHTPKKEPTVLLPIKIMNTDNELLLKLETLFNEVLRYEDLELQKLAREMIPVSLLQFKALDRIRDHQKKLKAGEIKGMDMSFELAQLIELMGWFKYSFFTWIDKPSCINCNIIPNYSATELMEMETELCRVEMYSCPACRQIIAFPRYNDPRQLLKTRCGRCGEWANCFALFCRALGYDTRYVYDNIDHVWCEVYDYQLKKWIHVDPCEGKWDTPLMYEHGWNTKLAYVIAVSRDDIQDVTWRYSSNHKEVIKRRVQCEGWELNQTIMSLREARQRTLSPARKKHLARRCLEELVQLMVERQPGDTEVQGRISGTASWRRDRGELGESKSYKFELLELGCYSIKYFTTSDTYLVTRDDVKIAEWKNWFTGTFEQKDMFRKEEKDWKMVYLAREEDAYTGIVAWKISTDCNHAMSSVSIRATSMLYENGHVKWTLTFDDNTPKFVNLGGTLKTFPNRFKTLIIKAELTGGRGDVGWQHAQLFRQTMDNKSCGFEVLTTVVSDIK